MLRVTGVFEMFHGDSNYGLNSVGVMPKRRGGDGK
jgi:hypothetical protein